MLQWQNEASDCYYKKPQAAPQGDVNDFQVGKFILPILEIYTWPLEDRGVHRVHSRWSIFWSSGLCWPEMLKGEKGQARTGEQWQSSGQRVWQEELVWGGGRDEARDLTRPPLIFRSLWIQNNSNSPKQGEIQERALPPLASYSPAMILATEQV